MYAFLKELNERLELILVSELVWFLVKNQTLNIVDNSPSENCYLNIKEEIFDQKLNYNSTNA